jgi:hypothetical protein
VQVKEEVGEELPLLKDADPAALLNDEETGVSRRGGDIEWHVEPLGDELEPGAHSGRGPVAIPPGVALFVGAGPKKDESEEKRKPKLWESAAARVSWC